MSQVEHGVRKILALPVVYDTLQWAMGAKANRIDFVSNYVKPKPNSNILDIGCGTGEILEFLPPDINYFGFDQSERYISHAKAKYGDRGRFENAFVDSLVLENLPAMDIVLASGLIHHLDDEQVTSLFYTAQSALKETGRLVAIDPCYVDGQNRFAKWLINMDRGNNVRNQNQYKLLGEQIFRSVESKVVDRQWIPYTHHILICS